MNSSGQTSSTWLPNLFPPYKTFTKSLTEGVASETVLLSCRLFIVDRMDIYSCLNKKETLPWDLPICNDSLFPTFIFKLCWGFTASTLVLTRTGAPGLKLNQWPIILNVGHLRISMSLLATFYFPTWFRILWPLKAQRNDLLFIIVTRDVEFKTLLYQIFTRRCHCWQTRPQRHQDKILRASLLLTLPRLCCQQ